VGVFAAATDRVRLNDACRERRGLLMSLSSVTREQHPFTDDLTPQIVVGSHHDFLKFATLFSLIKAEDLITAAGRHWASRHLRFSPHTSARQRPIEDSGGFGMPRSPKPICSKFSREKENR
jgi:hypothetical protein